MDNAGHGSAKSGVNGSTQVSVGLSLGLLIGVALALILDSWALGLGIGIPVGIVIGIVWFLAVRGKAGADGDGDAGVDSGD